MSEIATYPDECNHREIPERCWRCLQDVAANAIKERDALQDVWKEQAKKLEADLADRDQRIAEALVRCDELELNKLARILRGGSLGAEDRPQVSTFEWNTTHDCHECGVHAGYSCPTNCTRPFGTRRNGPFRQTSSPNAGASGKL